MTVRDTASNVAMAPFLVSIQSPAPVDLILSAGSLAFSAQTGGPAPPLQSFRGRHCERGRIPVQFSSSTGRVFVWLQLATSAGPTPGSALSVCLRIRPGLTPGFYQATITVSSPNAGSKAVPVSLTVAAAPASISVSPSSVQLFAPVGTVAPVTSAIQLSSISVRKCGFVSDECCGSAIPDGFTSRRIARAE